MSYTRYIFNIALATIVLFSTTLSGLACGFNWSPYGSYFECCDSSGYVVLTEKLADLTIPGESESVPIYAFFNSANNLPSPYLGMWRIGIFDISLVQVNAKQFRMQDPAGNEILLSWDQKKNLLDGAGWKGSFTRDRAKLWASCGWSVEFNKGKIAKMTTPHNKSLVFNYTDGCVSSITCDRKALIALGGLKDNTLEITINDKKLVIAKTDQPCVQRVGKADVIRGTEKSLHEIIGQGDAGSGRNYTYSVDEKMRPMITATSRYAHQSFALTWNPQTRQILRCGDWTYTRTRALKNRGDIMELVRTNALIGVESTYIDINAGIFISQRGKVKYSSCRFTSGPALGKIRWIKETEDGKVTHFQKYAYDEKGCPIRGQEDDDKLRFEYDDRNRTVTAWKNDKLLWRKSMDERGRILKVEYPNNKELRLSYKDSKTTSPAKAELIKGKKSLAVQLDREGLIKQETAVIRLL